MRLLHGQRQIGSKSDPLLRIVSSKFGPTSLPRVGETAIRKQLSSSAFERPPLGETGPMIHLDFRQNRKLGPMTRYPISQNDFQIDRIHNGAVCKEIGERLSIALGPQSIELQPRLGSLMKQLSEQA